MCSWETRPGWVVTWCVDVEDGVGAVPDVEPFETMAESVAGNALKQEQRFAGVDVQLSGQVMI